ncbi:hypothetical protein [Sorangium cellulosum]|uniref:hypothetical protein n=1 Tax=Sorangium cellulosum TaxID=56 RepID=UPI001A92F918|nr:hypothetical protein [Sorangium cellulosum]
MWSAERAMLGSKKSTWDIEKSMGSAERAMLGSKKSTRGIEGPMRASAPRGERGEADADDERRTRQRTRAALETADVAHEPVVQRRMIAALRHGAATP